MKLIWNLVGVGIILWVVRALCHLVGPESYGTRSGTIKMAGIVFLAGVVAVWMIMLGSRLFKIGYREGMQRSFWLLGFIFTVSLLATWFYFGKWVFILLGIVEEGGTPSSYLLWLFQ